MRGGYQSSVNEALGLVATEIEEKASLKMWEFGGKNATVEYNWNKGRGSWGLKSTYIAFRTRVRKCKKLLAIYRGIQNVGRNEPQHDCPDDLQV